MGSKKYKNKTCAYCGEEGASSTGDHIFAREFFLNDRRDNIPQVSSCESCNNIKSELEHYLTTLLPFGGNHQDSLKNLSEMAPKRLTKNGRLHQNLYQKQGEGWYKLDSGVVVRSMTLPLDFDKLEQLYEIYCSRAGIQTLSFAANKRRQCGSFSSH